MPRITGRTHEVRSGASILRLGFSLNGMHLAAVGHGPAVIRDLVSGEEVRTPSGHTEPVVDVALGVVDASAAPPGGADAGADIHWNQIAANTLAALPAPNGGAPPLRRRIGAKA